MRKISFLILIWFIVLLFASCEKYTTSITDSAGYGAYGVDHCWSPWGNYGSSTKATSITFSYPYTNSVGGSVGYDYYSEPYKLFDWR